MVCAQALGAGFFFGQQGNVSSGLVPPEPISSWSPTNLDSRLLEWVKADGESYSDTDPVPTMTDFGPSGRDFTQATTSKQPTFRTGIQNGLPAFYHDGGDSCVTASWSIPRRAGIVMALKVSSIGMLMEGGTATPWYFYGQNSFTYYQGTIGSGVNLSSGWLGTAATTISAYSTGTDMYVRKDGVELGTTSATIADATQSATLALFSRGGGSLFVTGYLFEMILIDDPDATDISNAETYLKNKWATP